MASSSPYLARIIVAGLAPWQFGLHMAVLNAPMEYMGCEGVEGASQDCIPGWTPAIPSSVYAIGGLLGSFAAGPLIKRYGLRKAFEAVLLVFAIGALLVASATSMSHIIFGRLITGVAAGGSIVVSPILISALSPKDRAGLFGATTQTSCNLGIIMAQVLGLFFAETHWRNIFWFAFLFAAAVVVAGYLYILRGGEIEGEASSTDAEPTPVPPVTDTNAGEPASEQTKLTVSTPEFLRESRYRYVLITTISIFVVQQLTGINAIIQYGVRVMADVMPSHAKLLNLGLSVANTLVTGASAFYIDRYGHKQLLLISLGLMSLFTASLAFGLVRGLAGFSALAAFATIASFAIGIGPIPFMYVSELCPREALGAAQSLGTVASWVSTFAILAFFPALQSAMGPSVFYVFSLSALVAAIWYRTWLPEPLTR